MITLRDYQEKCISGVRECFKKLRQAASKAKAITDAVKNIAVMLVAPTGAGKTVMFAYIAQATAERDNNVLVMAHRKELCTQCGNKLMENGVLDFGYINPQFTPDYTKKIQVGTIQSIVSRFDALRKAGWKPSLIIIDEAHRSLADTYLEILKEWPDAMVLGVTATPVRGDGRSLSEIYQDMVSGPTINELIAGGHLVRPRTFGPDIKIDLSQVKVKKNGEYDLKSLEKAVDQTKITGDAVDHYRKICDGVPAVAFCVSIKHAKNVAEEFSAAGYKVAHIDGTMSDGERTEILEAVSRGELNIVTSVDLITEGFDAPMLQCAIMLRPTRSLGLFIQMAGRVLRTFEGKACAYILDHAGLSIRHGFVDQDRTWTLDGFIKEDIDAESDGALPKDKNNVRQCTNCYKLYEIAPKCDHCGHVYEVRSRQVDLKEGQLVELNIGAGDKLANIAESDRRLLDELRALAANKGYSEQWAVSIFNDAVAQGLV